VLGEGAIALHRVAYALDSVRSRLTAFGENFFESEQRARPYEDLRLLEREMDALTEMFTDELGREHEAVAAFVGARAAVADVLHTLGLLRDPGAPEAAEILTTPEVLVERVEEHRTSFDAARDRFMQAVRRASDA
jgi:hypothetical protein